MFDAENLPIVMLISLGITLIVEIVFAFLLKVRSLKDLINIFLANIVTNPLVVSISMYVNMEIGLTEKYFSLIFLEIFAVVVEGIIYKKYLKYKTLNPFIFSLTLNALSFFIGAYINQFIYY